MEALFFSVPVAVQVIAATTESGNKNIQHVFCVTAIVCMA
jgi:hypothetical protein